MDDLSRAVAQFYPATSDGMYGGPDLPPSGEPGLFPVDTQEEEGTATPQKNPLSSYRPSSSSLNILDTYLKGKQKQPLPGHEPNEEILLDGRLSLIQSLMNDYSNRNKRKATYAKILEQFQREGETK